MLYIYIYKDIYIYIDKVGIWASRVKWPGKEEWD